MASKRDDSLRAAEAQSQAFIDAARELGCDDDPAHFDEMLKKVARHKPGPEDAEPATAPENQSAVSKGKK